MRTLLIIAVVALTGCAQAGVVITNAPSSLGNCMPERPSGGCP